METSRLDPDLNSFRSEGKPAPVVVETLNFFRLGIRQGRHQAGIRQADGTNEKERRKEKERLVRELG